MLLDLTINIKCLKIYLVLNIILMKNFEFKGFNIKMFKNLSRIKYNINEEL
jgi:hypothetical protein